MLDAVDSGTEARADAGVAVRVRGNPDAGSVRLVDDRGQLLIGVLLAPAAELNDMTPPDAEILITSRRT